MTTASSVFDRFRQDHALVLSRLDGLERAIEHGGRLDPDGSRLIEDVAALLRDQFASHVTAEERVLYPALADAFPEAAPSLRPLQAEHVEMRAMVARLATLLAWPASAARDEQLVVQARDLVDLLRLHIRKEELAVFNVAERVLTETELALLSARVAGHRVASDPESGPEAGKGICP